MIGIWHRRATLGVVAALALALAACASEPQTALDPDATVAAGSASSTSVGGGDGSVVGGSTTAAAPASVASSTTVVTTTSTTPVPATTAEIGSATSTTAFAAPGAEVLRLVGEYVGASPGLAASGSIGVGWVNQEGSAPSFSEATVGFAAAVQYLNLQLNGVQGRVIELHTCAIQREADGARCAEQLANDPAVSVVVVGVTALGNQALLDGLRDVKPVVLANPIATADFLATDAVAYTPGAPGIVQGLARFAAERLPTGPPAKVAVVYPYGLAGEISFQLLAKPVLDRFGIVTVGVPVIESSTPEAYLQRFQESGATDASAVLSIVGTRGCIAVERVLRDLGVSPVVLATDACRSAAMTSHLATLGAVGDFPNGWYVGSNGVRIGAEGNVEVQTYLEVVAQYLQQFGLPIPDLTNYAASSFSAMLVVAKLFHQVGPDNVTPESMRAATRGFTGTAWLTSGAMRCGYTPFYPTLCGAQMGVEQYLGGAWVPIADAQTGSSIELGDLVPG